MKKAKTQQSPSISLKRIITAIIHGILTLLLTGLLPFLLLQIVIAVDPPESQSEPLLLIAIILPFIILPSFLYNQSRSIKNKENIMDFLISSVTMYILCVVGTFALSIILLNHGKPNEYFSDLTFFESLDLITIDMLKELLFFSPIPLFSGGIAYYKYKKLTDI